MSRIFISYKRVDKDKVFKIKDQVESALGEKCWIDLDGIESDAQFMNVIIKAIRECEVLLFMYSKTHAQITNFEKDWTVRELNFASKKEKRIVFVNIDGSPLSDEFEFMYGTKQQLDGRSVDAINRLCFDLSRWLGIETREKGSAYNHIDKKEDVIDKYEIELVKPGAAKLALVKAIKETLGMGLKEAKDIVDSAPIVLPFEFNKEQAYSTKRLIEEIGATVVCRPNSRTAKYEIELVKTGAAKLALVKAIKETLGMGLKEAKDIVDSAPIVLPFLFDKEQAYSTKRLIEEIGATVVCRPKSRTW